MRSLVPRVSAGRWICFFLVLYGIQKANLAAPQISRIEPLALSPGKRTVLTFTGKDLEAVSNLWTSFAGEVEKVPGAKSGQVAFAIRCPADASGVHALQLIGNEGASPFRLVMIDALEPSASARTNKAEALTILPPIAVDAVSRNEKIDHYKFASKAGESYSIEAIAHRIGSQMDPVVRVFDSAGKEVAFCDDEPGVWKDARFRFTAPLDGEYTIAVHDVGYGGGAGYDYRLRVSNDPLIWYTFPLVDFSEVAARFEAVGEGTEAGVSRSPANPPTVPLLPAGAQVAEMEPNDARTNAQRISYTVTLNGRLANARDTDVFHFAVKKGERLKFKSGTRSLGSPCDLVLTLRAEDGSQAAQSDLSSANDAVVTHTFSTEGNYVLEVRELSGTAPTNVPYRVTIEQSAASVELSTEENVVAIKRAETAKLKITAQRSDYDGPVNISLSNPADGIVL
ncbi:MAG TPA: hypothetical protein VM735_10490, partial [Candidatus Kapabacteria bacterium]|nr:hypothetical protein [Candidatus Kapabacteria bacterium]